MSFYSNFVKLCNETGKKPSAVAVELGLSKSLVTRWKHGGGVSDSTAHLIANYFGCTIEELQGEKKEKLIGVADELDPVTQELFDLVDGMSSEDLLMVIDMIKAIKKRRGDGE